MATQEVLKVIAGPGAGAKKVEEKVEVKKDKKEK